MTDAAILDPPLERADDDRTAVRECTAVACAFDFVARSPRPQKSRESDTGVNSGPRLETHNGDKARSNWRGPGREVGWTGTRSIGACGWSSRVA